MMKPEEDLRDKIEKSIKTPIVGALIALENSRFGELWGHGKNKGELSEDEEQWRAEWEEVRNEILDKCEDGIGCADYHLSRFKVQAKSNYKYNYHFKIQE